MKLTLEFDDEGAVYELMDSIVLSHLKSTKKSIKQWGSVHKDDIAHDEGVLAAIDVLIAYYGPVAVDDDDET